MSEKMDINLDTKLADILTYYPELEDILIAQSPRFVRLKNPILRKTVLKVTSLRQAATMAGISAAELLKKLRQAVGLPSGGCTQETLFAYMSDGPKWMDPVRKWVDLDIRNHLALGTSPVPTILMTASKLRSNEVLRLISKNLPMNIIDQLRGKGFHIWSEAEDDLFYSYVVKVRK